MGIRNEEKKVIKNTVKYKIGKKLKPRLQAEETRHCTADK